MISEDEALDRIFAAIEPLPVETIATGRAAGRFAAADIHSPRALPGFDQSAMDGYALRAADTPGELRIVGEQPACAARGLSVAAGETVRIFTGAPLPGGADAVVMQEDVSAHGDRVRVPDTVEPGEFIRRRGEDACEGQKLIDRGDAITPARIGLLHAAGLAAIKVHRRPRVAIITTGDEIRPPGATLQPGELHDSNSPMLAAQLGILAEIIGTAHCPDNPAALAATIRSFPQADAIVLCAGVSVGDHDPVHGALRELGAAVELWRVAVKPGKPFLFASLGRQKIFGLPGNPVSAFVTAHLFVQPALREFAGSRSPQPRAITLPLGADLANTSLRTHYVRAIRRDGHAWPASLQRSGNLVSLAGSEILLRLPPESEFRRGENVTALPIDLWD